MNKSNLIRKIEVFKVSISKIAFLAPALHGLLESALKDITALNLNQKEIEHPIMDALSGGDYNPDELVMALEGAVSGMRRDIHLPQVKRIQQLISILRNKIPVPTQQFQQPAQQPVNTQKNIVKNPTINMLQIFLNKALSNDIIAGKRAPIKQDSIWGPETAAALSYWAKLNNIKYTDANQLINIALGKSK